MDAARTARIVRLYADIARPLMLQAGVEVCGCIAACRLTMEVLARYGVQAETVPMQFVAQVKARNLAYVCGLSPENKERARATAASFIELRKGWDGHVVVIATEHESMKYLIDPSFDQVGGPLGGHVAPFILVVAVPKKIEPAFIHASLMLENDTGEVMVVEYIPSGDDTYLATPAWEADHLAPAIGLICREMDARMEVE